MLCLTFAQVTVKTSGGGHLVDLGGYGGCTNEIFVRSVARRSFSSVASSIEVAAWLGRRWHLRVPRMSSVFLSSGEIVVVLRWWLVEWWL